MHIKSYYLIISAYYLRVLRYSHDHIWGCTWKNILVLKLAFFEVTTYSLTTYLWSQLVSITILLYNNYICMLVIKLPITVNYIVYRQIWVWVAAGIKQCQLVWTFEPLLLQCSHDRRMSCCRSQTMSIIMYIYGIIATIWGINVSV